MVEATAVDAVTERAKLRVAIRPERLSLTAPGHGLLTARVQQEIYAGNATTLLLGTAGGQSLKLRLPAGSVSPGPALGDLVGLRWAPQDARAFGAAA